MRTEQFVHHRGPRDPDRPVGQGVRRRPRGPVPRAVPAHGRDRGPAARAHGDDLGAVAHQPRARAGLPHRVRPRRPRRHRRGAGDAREGRQASTPTCRGRWPDPRAPTPTVRHYSHDAWNSISATIKLPSRGAVMGALAPILTPSESGERRSFVVAYPIVSQSKADRQSGNAEWAADLAEGMNEQARRARPAPSSATTPHKARGLDAKLARGNALTRPYAVCTVTVPKTLRITEFGRRLDASVRRAGFAPLRLDLAQDTAFAASTIPLGISLTRTRRRLMTTTRTAQPPPRRAGPGHGRGCSPTSATTCRPRPRRRPARPRSPGCSSTPRAAVPRDRGRGWAPAKAPGVGVADDQRPGTGVLAVRLRPGAAARPGRRWASTSSPAAPSTPTRSAGCCATTSRSTNPNIFSFAKPGTGKSRHHQGVLQPDDAVRLPHPGPGRPQGRVRDAVPRARRRAVRHRPGHAGPDQPAGHGPARRTAGSSCSAEEAQRRATIIFGRWLDPGPRPGRLA